MIRTIITLEKPADGYKLVAQFIQETYDNGRKEYFMYTYKLYNGNDMSDRRYTKFKNKDEGNIKYLEFVKQGYKKIDSWKFTPDKIDADGNFLEG